MVEQDAVAGEHAVGFAVVHSDPLGVQLGHAVGASWIERGGLALRDLLHLAVELAGRGLVELCLLFQTEDSYGFQQSQCSDGI